MNRKPVAQLPDVPGIDLQFRPRSYFWPLGLEKHLLTRVKGAERKVALKQLIDAGLLDQIPDFLAQSALSEEDRDALGRIHPDFMGGEYLPDLRRNEVEIARITIASTTQDVTCVYARRGKTRIYYRVVDEYDDGFLSEKRTRTSRQTLALGELEAFFNGAWSIYDILASNFGYRGYKRDDLLGFIVSVDSQFYPQIGELYERRIDAWGVARRPELVSNKVGEENSEPVGSEVDKLS